MASIAGMNSTSTQLPWERTLGDFLNLAVANNPEKTFVEIASHTLTYRGFQDKVSHAAGMFQSLGINPGDRVGVFLPNCPEFLYSWFGLATIGAIAVPINTAYKRDETAYILNNAEISLLVAHTSLLDTAHAAADLAPSVQTRLYVATPPSPRCPCLPRLHSRRLVRLQRPP